MTDPTAPLPDEEWPGLVDHPSSIGVRRHVPAEPDGPMIECGICGDYTVNGIEVHEMCLPALRAERTAPLDVERLTRAMDAVLPDAVNDHQPGNRVRARAIAAEYARLVPATGEGDSDD